MSTRPSLSEIKAARSALVVWGFVEEACPDPDPRGPRRWQLTALGHQHTRFMQAPHEEPSFLAEWIASFERRYPGFDEEALRKDLEDVDQAAERLRIGRQARMLYTVAKMGDVRAFHRVLTAEEAAP